MCLVLAFELVYRFRVTNITRETNSNTLMNNEWIDIGSEARELTGAGKKLEVATRSSNYAGTARTLLQARPCQRDVDCNFQCPRIQGGQCNNHHGTCDCF